MVNVRYSPRLRYGISKKKRVIWIKKNLRGMKKKKWFTFIAFYQVKSKLFEPFFRKDIHHCLATKNLKNKQDSTHTHTKRPLKSSRQKKKRPLELQRKYARTFRSIKQLSSYLILKTKFLRKIFLNIIRPTQKVSTKVFFDLIETRLDLVLLRTNFVSSLYQARCLISSGYVLVNKNSFRVASYRLNTGDSVTIKKKYSLRSYFFNVSTFNLPAEYLEINYNLLCFVVIHIPSTLKENEMIKQYSFFFSLQDITNFIKK